MRGDCRSGDSPFMSSLPSVGPHCQPHSGNSLYPCSSTIKKCLYKDQQRNHGTTMVGAYLAFRLVELFADQETLKCWSAGCLGSSLALIKKESLCLPVIGWSMWFSGYRFLQRSWAKDGNTLKSGFEGLKDFPLPLWLALVVEGTRFTQAKLVAAQEYAASAGLPIPRNILIPRTKGFVAAVTHLRSFVPTIYNITVAIPKNEPRPTLLRTFRGCSSAVHVYLERHLMQKLPETSSGIAQWCKDVFVAKMKEAARDPHFPKVYKISHGAQYCFYSGDSK